MGAVVVNDRSPALSASLAHVIKEAEDIAAATKQSPNSAHVLLAFYTSRNKAERFLRERGLDEDKVLDHFDPKKAKEPKTAVREIFERAAQVAAGCGTMEINGLHVLVAMTRVRESIAYRLLEETGEAIANLRTRALNILTGDIPRWLDTRSPGEAFDVAFASSLPNKSQARAAKEDATKRAAMSWSPPIVTKAKPKVKIEDPPTPVGPPPVATSPAPAPKPIERPRWSLDPDSYPWLTSLGRNLSEEAAKGELDRLVGREKEVETLIDILGKRRANNPVLIGEPGVGKTAVVEGLAQRLVKNPPTDRLGEKIIVGLDVGALLVGTHLRGSFSEKLEGIKE